VVDVADQSMHFIFFVRNLRKVTLKLFQRKVNLKTFRHLLTLARKLIMYIQKYLFLKLLAKKKKYVL